MAPSFFDLLASVGIALERPAGFTAEAAPPTPRFATTPDRAADALVYIASVSEHRVEQFLRTLTESAVVESVSMDRGYQRADETEPFGYRDGLRNVKSLDRSKVVFVHRDGGQPDEPAWADGGTYMTTIKIIQNRAAFEALGGNDVQDAVIGRAKDGTRLDLPAGTDPRQEGPDPSDALPPSSHVRKAGPRGRHDDTQIFRRGLPFVEVVEGRVQVGLTLLVPGLPEPVRHGLQRLDDERPVPEPDRRHDAGRGRPDDRDARWGPRRDEGRGDLLRPAV